MQFARTLCPKACAASLPLLTAARHTSSTTQAGEEKVYNEDKFYSKIAGRSKPKNHDPTKTEELLQLWREATPRAEAERRLNEKIVNYTNKGNLPSPATGAGLGTPARSQFQDELDEEHILGQPASGSVDMAEHFGNSFKDTRPVNPKETVEDRRKRLIFQSRYRGMVEMDLICGHFARVMLADLPDDQLLEYDTLLKQLDNDLFRWLVMRQEVPEEINNLKCFHTLREFVENRREELLGHY